jgi:hypothetical protein
MAASATARVEVERCSVSVRERLDGRGVPKPDRERPIDPERTAATTSRRLTEPPEKDVARRSAEVRDGAAPGGRSELSSGRDWVESIDLRPETRRCALVWNPFSEPVGVLGDASGESGVHASSV